MEEEYEVQEHEEHEEESEAEWKKSLK